jgi:hypothetical protein
MRWKADLPKMPRLPKVPLESGDPAPDALGPPPPPSAYREKNPAESQPVEYTAPSLLGEHRGLAVLFLAAGIGFAFYCWRAPRRTAALEVPAAHGAAPSSAAAQSSGAARGSGAAPTPGAAPTSGAAQTAARTPAQAPIYVEAVPDKDR